MKHETTYLRGARSFVAGRFETLAREPFDDGWTPEERDAAELQTSVTEERARSIISRNDSPDIGFSQSINPYRGCEHGCIYCVHGDTAVLMADCSVRRIADIHPGDLIYGTAREGWYRLYVKSRVLAHWSVIKPAYRIALEDGTELIAGPDHRFLTERGWKFVTGTEQGQARRPHLTTGNKMMGVGAFAHAPVKNEYYRLGYLCGVIRGDGHLASHRFRRGNGAIGTLHQCRLALCDVEALLRVQDYLREWQIDTQHFVFQRAAAGRRLLHAIRTQRKPSVDEIHALIAWPMVASREWSAGFLAGIYDAEGSYNDGCLRICNTDSTIIEWTGRSLGELGFRCAVEPVARTASKPNAAELLRAELSKPGYVPSPIAIGANTDCYQPIERKFRITRQIVEILAECEHPFTMVTKSALVERDLDLLAPMAKKNLVKVFVSIASLDRTLARKLEPRAASPQRRMDVLRNLAQAGVPCGVMVAALIPGLNDKTLEEVLEAASAAGAAEAAYVIMRLPNELKELFKEWLAAHYPERAGHVISIVRQMRGGRG